MERFLFLILAVLLCGCEPDSESQPDADKQQDIENPLLNELDEKLANYQFHDDNYPHSNNKDKELTEMPDCYYLVVKSSALNRLREYLYENDFTIIELINEHPFFCSDDVLPSELKECSCLCIKGIGDVSKIPEVLYVDNMYNELAGVRTNVIIIKSPDVEHSELIERCAEKLNVILIGLQDDFPLFSWPPECFQRYMLVCTTESAGNCLEIANCFSEVCGLSRVYVWFRGEVTIY